MAKQLNVDLRVQADTSGAKQQLADLKRQLADISTKPTHLFDDQDLQKASAAASELAKHLQAATNVDTGKLDLTRFASNLKKSGKELKDYKADLERIGPAGQQAFLQVAQSITAAEAPTLRLTQRMNEFVTSLKNTARWQISSSMLHAVMGTVQQAYGYAQDLNESLNNIRIVTGQSTEQMAKFAEQANKAARELSTTTTEYTDAALIFYQQGLDDKTVQEYTDVTIKMANVTGDGAQQVSSYMTAIWNNFNKDGDESAEHYADVLTALGASTASSTAEIAAGLEKFASIADVTGLSYDYAAASLATLVANTRQSADTVGTSLKTIFSRLEGVKLGETLEDGVGLTKYTEALQKIGVDVLDVNGEMKNLDDILDATAEKWDTLTNAQKMATAQTVAGVRQYNNFISLMDNWDDMKTNLDTAENADGSLQKQADIYEQSWAGAQKRLKASMQELYKDLIDEDFFMSLTDGFAKVVDIIDGILKGMGGVKGLVFTILSFATQKLSKEIPAALDRLKDNAIYLTGFGDKIAKNTQGQVSDALSSPSTGSTDSAQYNVQLEGAQKLSAMKEELLQKQHSLSEAEKESYQAAMDKVQADYEILSILGQQVDKENEKLATMENELATSATQAESDRVKTETGAGFDPSTFKEQKKLISETIGELKGYYKALSQIKTQAKVFSDQAKQYKTNLKGLKENNEALKQAKHATDEYLKSLQKSGKIKLNEKQWDKLKAAIADTGNNAEEFVEALEEIGSLNGVDGAASAFYAVDESSGAAAQSVEVLEQGLESAENRLNELGVSGDGLSNLEQQISNVADKENQLAINADAAGRGAQNLSNHTVKASEVLGNAASAMMSFSSMASSAESTWHTLFLDKDATLLDKITAGIGFATTALFAWNAATKLAKSLNDLATASLMKKIGADAAAAVSEGTLTLAQAANTAGLWANLLALMANPFFTGACLASLAIAAVTIGVMTAKTKANTAAIEENTKAATDNANSLKEQEQENKNNLQQMTELLAIYKETGEGKEQLDDVTRTLAESYGIEGAALAKLTGEYEDYNKVREQALDSHKDELTDRLDAEQDAVDAAMQSVRKSHRNAGLDGNGSRMEGNNIHLTLDGVWDEAAEDAILGRYFDDLYTDDSNDFGLEIDATDPQAIIDTYDKLKQARKDMDDELSAEHIENSGIANDLDQWLEAMEEDVETLREHMAELENLKLELGQVEGAEGLFDELEQVDTYAEYTSWVKKTKDALKELGYTDEEIAQKMQMLQDSAINPNISGFQELSDAAKGLHDVYGINEDQAANYISSLSDEDRALFWKIDFDEYQTEEAWNTQMEFLRNKADEEALQVRIETVSTAQDQLVDKGELDDETRASLEEQYGDKIDWETFDASSAIDQLEMINKLSFDEVDNLKAQYDAYQDMLKAQEEAKAADQERVQTLKDNIANLEESMKGATGTAQTEMQKQIDNWNEELEELVNKDYSIDIDLNIDDTLLDQFDLVVDGIVSKADAMKTAAELIGEGFIVAAEDAQTLANIYPELLANATVYEDGRVQLDQAAVKAILGDEASLLTADKDATRQKLESQITLLDAQIKFYETKAKLLQQALDGEISYQECVQGIADAEAQFETDIDDWCTQNNMDNDMTSTNYALDNLDALDKRIQEVSEHYSAMLAGELVKATSSSHVTGDTTTTHAGRPTDKNGQDMTYALEQQLESTNAQLESLYDERANLVALEAKLGDAVTNSLESMQSAAAGKGGKIDKDKSGGSSKEKTEKDLKILDDEIERYHEIKELLEDIEAEVNKYSKAKDRAWGAGKIANINKEINALSKQKSALQEYQRQAKAYMSSDAAKAASYGWSVGSDGNINNYDSNMAAITAEYNAAVAAYNSTEAGSDAEKAAGKNVEAAQKKFDEAKKALKNYEDSADLVRDLEQQIIDASYEIADLKLEAIEYTVELKLDFDERQLKLFEDIMKDFGDMADHALDKISKIEECIGVIFDEMNTNKSGLSQMLGLAGVGSGTVNSLLSGNLSESGVEEIAKKMQEENGDLNYNKIMSDIEGYMDKLIDLNEQLRNYREQVFETLENAISEYMNDLDRATDKIDKITKLTSGYKDLIEAIGKANVDATGALTKALNKAVEEESKSAMVAAKAKEDYAKTVLDDAKALYQTAIESGDEWAINRAETVLKQAEDDYANALQSSQDATKSFVDAVATSFSDAIAQVITDLDKNLGELSHLREQFDQAKELSAQYLKDYTKIYELSKLNRQVMASIDETDNVNAKKELLEFQKEIVAYQEQGVQMSQYELDYLQKRFELKQAEIALQEAQNAKSQVSMVQDNEGNMSYVYTADDQQVADAQQNYEDKLYELQQLNGQYINELQENIITMQEEMSAKLQEIAEDDSLSYEEKQERMDEVTAYYLERIEFYSSQLELVLDNNKELYENEWLEYHKRTGYKISANKDYVDSWEETSIAILTNVKEQDSYLQMLEDAITRARDEAKQSCQEVIFKLDEVGLTTSNLTTIVNGATSQLTSDAQMIASSAQQMSAQYQSSINQIMSAVSAFTSQYASMISQSILNNQRLIASMQLVIQMASAMAAALGAQIGTGGTGGVNNTGDGGLGNNNPAANNLQQQQQQQNATTNTADAATIAGIAASIWMDGSKSGWGNDPIRSGKVTAEYDQATATAVQQYINQHGPNGDIYSQWYNQRDQLSQYYAKYDTGGYTGSWGTSDGKMAMLHQKELVLNASDTANMLSIVDMVRDISAMIDLNAMSAMLSAGISSVTASLNNNNALEQEVHITAEFPNATDKNEILEAFDNVINLAAQYANRK